MEFLCIVRNSDSINIIEQWDGVRTAQFRASTSELESAIACAVRHGLVSSGMDRLDLCDGFITSETFEQKEN